MTYGYVCADEFEFPCVYFIRDWQGAIKIGKANNVLKRLSQLQTGNAKELTIHFVMKVESINDAFALEEEIHKKFEYCNIHGEWFSEKDILDWIAQKEIITANYIFKGLLA